ncbi:transposase, partial [Verminephrobacter sp. Larva24]
MQLARRNALSGQPDDKSLVAKLVDIRRHRAEPGNEVEVEIAGHGADAVGRRCQPARLVSRETTITIRFHEALDLPRAWAEDPIGQKEGSKKAGVPEDITLATQPQIALQQIRSLLQPGAPRHWVLADAGYGIDSAFRQGLTDRGLAYV